MAYARVDERGIIRKADPGMAGLLGYDDPADLVGRRIDDFYVESGQRSDLLNKAVSQPGCFGELAVRHRDGRAIWVREYPRPLSGADGTPTGYEAVWFDITSYKATEMDLRQNQSLFEAFIRTMPQPGLLLSSDGKALMANAAVTSALRIRLEDIVGRSIYDVVPPEWARLRPLLEGVINAGKMTRFEESWGGRAFVIFMIPALDEQGRTTRVMVVGADITERKKTEEDIQHRMKMQDLVARVSTRFINLAPGEVEEGVQKVLQEVAEFTDADWSFLFLWGDDGGQADVGQEWHRPGVPPALESLQTMDIKKYPWAAEGLHGLDALRLSDIESLPPEAEREIATLKAQGVRSAIVVPILIGSSLRGAVCLSTHKRPKDWPEDTVSLLRLVGQILFNAMDRKRYDAALRESEKKYRTLVDQSLLGIYITQQHVLKFCNQRFAEMFGFDRPEDLTGLIVRHLVHPKSWETVEREAMLRETGQKEISRYEITALRRDGSSFEAEILGSRIMFEGRPAIQGMMIDITERKRAQHLQDCLYRISETSRASSSLEDLFQSLHGIITELMPTPNFYIALMNPADGLVHFPYFVDEFDPTPSPQLPGKRLTDYVLRTGETLLASPEKFAELEARGEVESVGTPSIDWLGVPLKMEGETRGVLVVQSYTPGVRYSETEKNILKFVSDQVALAISRKQVESTVVERERFFSGIFDSIQDGLSISDMDYTVVRVNKKMEQWYAHAMPLIGKKCFAAYHLQDEGCAVCPVRETYATGKAAMEVVPLIGPGGEKSGWLDLYSFPLHDQETGRMKGVIEYVRDTTEQHRAEEALKSSLQEKEVLLREVHHRVKNNMQVISSLLNLQSSQMKDPVASELFRDSQRRIRSMALVHERLYQSADLSRIEFSGYLRSLAVQLFNSFRVDATAVRVKVEAEEAFLNINTAVPCGLISNELLSNALKHAFPEGRRGEVLVCLRRLPDEAFELRVEDDGVGLPPDLDWRNSPSLGLQVVNMLAAQLDGTVDMTGRRGTRFRVVFKELQYSPLSQDAPEVQ